MKQIAVLLFFAAAAGGANPPAPKPFAPSAARFHHQPAGVEANAAIGEWWRQFGDPLLDSLIERAGRANVDVRTAGARLAETRAMRGRSKSALLPNVDTTAAATRLRGGFNQGVIRVPEASAPGPSGNFVSPFETSVVSGGFNMRWELDLSGGARKELRAATADAAAAEADLRDIQNVVRAEVARNYVELRGFEEQAAIVRAHIEAERDLLRLIRARADAGLAAGLDVERQSAQLAAVEASLPAIEAQRLQSAHRIAVLSGGEPAALLAELEKSAPALAEPAVPGAVPSEVLKRRPGLRAAESRIAAAYARAGAARADLYPKLVITGLSGRQSQDLGGLTLGAGNFFSIGPGISLPVFNGGRIRMNIAVQDARLEQAVHAYEGEVLAAFEEVENALVAREAAAAQSRHLAAGLHAAARSVELARELYLRGLADFLAVLDAQRQRYLAERELAAARTDLLRGAVAVFRALGQ